MGIGERLRAAREARGLSLEEAAAGTRIKRIYLEALESEAFSLLPSPAHARGFLRRYARWLGLDEKMILAEWDGTPAAIPPVRPSRMPSMFDLTRIPARPAFPWRPLATAGFAALLLIGVLVLVRGPWGGQSAGLPPAPTVTGAVSIPSATAIPGSVTTVPALRLEVEASEHVWVRIRADGQMVYQGLLRPGEARTWEARSSLELDTGNAAALQVRLNGRPEGPLGGRGEMVRKTWSR
ncbi:helix-turn-helix domain-containing protein [Thermoflexus sp.]|uniref:helix-turn-helix domain-containing protein n=1 Tax=Thermoflexus sp. TaxID=1969742 RepID=UPI002ADDD24D|nr:helix-turn-helix domain-containing protein [Thermoflexus sp.]